jgi:hypothetical protein
MSANLTNNLVFMEQDGARLVRIFPCPCGQKHRGDYAEETFIQHSCFHETELTFMPDGTGSGVPPMVVCSCGKTWNLTLDGLTNDGLKEVAEWALRIVDERYASAIRGADLTFVAKDGSKHIWPCEEHKGATILPNQEAAR